MTHVGVHPEGLYLLQLGPSFRQTAAESAVAAASQPGDQAGEILSQADAWLLVAATPITPSEWIMRALHLQGLVDLGQRQGLTRVDEHAMQRSKPPRTPFYRIPTADVNNQARLAPQGRSCSQ